MPLDLAIRAREVAEDQGMTRSSFIRQAMRRNLETYALHERDLLSRAHAFRTKPVSP
jgi:metal-responsive CopG/Arc/MetJ family transcriptional regulator